MAVHRSERHAVYSPHLLAENALFQKSSFFSPRQLRSALATPRLSFLSLPWFMICRNILMYPLLQKAANIRSAWARDRLLASHFEGSANLSLNASRPGCFQCTAYLSGRPVGSGSAGVPLRRRVHRAVSLDVPASTGSPCKAAHFSIFVFPLLLTFVFHPHDVSLTLPTPPLASYTPYHPIAGVCAPCDHSVRLD